MQKFEYFILEESSGISNTILNDYGKQGWELISIVPNDNAINKEENFLYYFKRPVQ